MIVSEHIDQLKNSLSELKKQQANAKIGFVPTMGALHEGHLSLVQKALEQTDIVVVSVFVNPSQFNDKGDLDKYPRTIEADKKLLEKVGAHILFLPSENVMYPDGIPDYKIDFEGIDKVMEGQFRAGHFKGVAMIVERLFDTVQADKAYFGLKDFQQVAIIKQMVKQRKINIEIVPVATVRSPKGLALSSRNQLLSDEQKEEALIIYQTLQKGKEWAKEIRDAGQLKSKMIHHFQQGSLKLEYLEIVDPNSLQPLKEMNEQAHCCIAAYCGNVRLIDNLSLS